MMHFMNIPTTPLTYNSQRPSNYLKYQDDKLLAVTIKLQEADVSILFICMHII